MKKAAIIYIDFATGIEQRDKTLAAASTNGWEFLDCDVAYPVSGVPDFKPYVQKLKDCGAEAVYFIGGDDAFRSVWEAAAQLEYRPLVVGDGGKYGTDMATWNKDGYVGVELLRPDQLRAARAGLVEPGRRAVPRSHRWSGHPHHAALGDGGLGVPAVGQPGEQVRSRPHPGLRGEQPARRRQLDRRRPAHPVGPWPNKPGECALTLHLDGSTWEQWDPKEQGTYSCDPDNFVTVDTPGVAAAQLGPDRVSQKYTQ